MKQIQFNKQKYPLPESWSEVSFAQLKQLMKLDRDDTGQLTKAAKTVSILSGISYDALVDGNPNLVFMLLHRLDFLDDSIDDSQPVMHFSIGGDTYYVNDLEGSTFREYADYQSIDNTFSKEPEEGLTKKLAILCRKEGEKPLKDSKQIVARAELFENLSAETVLRINSFFLLRRKQSEHITRQFSELQKQLKGKEQELRSCLTVSGAGMRWRTRWRNLLLSFSLSLIRRLPMSWLASSTK